MNKYCKICKDYRDNPPPHVCEKLVSKEDKNGHKIDEDDNLIFDSKCHGCDAPFMNKDLEENLYEIVASAKVPDCFDNEKEMSLFDFTMGEDREEEGVELVKKLKDFISSLIASERDRGVCKECGEKKTQAHHPDYSKPLDIIWLCKKHHAELHYKHKDFVSKNLKRGRGKFNQ